MLKYFRFGKHMATVSIKALKFVILLWFTHKMWSDLITGNLTWLVRLLSSRINVFRLSVSLKNLKSLWLVIKENRCYMKRNEKAIIQSGKRQTQAKEEQHGQNLTQPLLHLRVLLHVPSPQFDASYLVHAKISPEKGCHGEGWEFPLAAMKMSLFASASSPVARNHWGKFELIIRERGDEGSSFPSLPTHALRSFPSSLSCASRLSRVLTSSPIPIYTWESQWRRQYLLGKDRIGFVTISLKNNILKYSHRGSRDVRLLHMWIPLLNPHPLELLAWLWVLIQKFEFPAMM